MNIGGQNGFNNQGAMGGNPMNQNQNPQANYMNPGQVFLIVAKCFWRKYE